MRPASSYCREGWRQFAQQAHVFSGGVGRISLSMRVAKLNTAQLVEKFYMPLYRFGLSLTRKESDAGDLTQQTFYRWQTKGHQLRDAAKVKTWLFTTLYREFLAKKRHDQHFADMEDDSMFVEPEHISPSIVDTLDAAIVQKALLALHDRYRAPVTLFYMQQHSYREIAEILEVPIGTVMSRISRGKAELRESLIDFAAAEARKVVSIGEMCAHG